MCAQIRKTDNFPSDLRQNYQNDNPQGQSESPNGDRRPYAIP